MLETESKPTREIEEAERDHLAGAVFPLAMPSIASPGAMLAIVILTDNHTESIAEQAITAGLLLIVLLLTLVLLLVAIRLARPVAARAVLSRHTRVRVVFVRVRFEHGTHLAQPGHVHLLACRQGLHIDRTTLQPLYTVVCHSLRAHFDYLTEPCDIGHMTL